VYYPLHCYSLSHLVPSLLTSAGLKNATGMAVVSGEFWAAPGYLLSHRRQCYRPYCLLCQSGQRHSLRLYYSPDLDEHLALSGYISAGMRPAGAGIRKRSSSPHPLQGLLRLCGDAVHGTVGTDQESGTGCSRLCPPAPTDAKGSGRGKIADLKD